MLVLFFKHLLSQSLDFQTNYGRLASQSISFLPNFHLKCLERIRPLTFGLCKRILRIFMTGPFPIKFT